VIVLTKEFKKNIREVSEYSKKEFTKEIAENYIIGINKKIGDIANKPHKAKRVKNLKEEAYFVRYKSHHIFYEVQDNKIILHRLRHCKMDEIKTLKP